MNSHSFLPLPVGKEHLKNPVNSKNGEKQENTTSSAKGMRHFHPNIWSSQSLFAGLFCRDGAVVSEHSPLRKVPVLRFPDRRSYVGKFCWFCTQLREVFLSTKNQYDLIERVSIECRKAKTKVITLANQKGQRQSSKPIKTRSNYA